VLAQVGRGRRLATEHQVRLLEELRKNFLGSESKANAAVFRPWLQEMSAILAPNTIEAVATAAGYADFAKREWLKEQMDIRQVPNSVDRLWAADILAWLGDDRPGVGVKAGIPDLEWVSIPAGDFLFGEKNEKTPGQSFRISRYPITTAQFEAFLADKDYKNDEWWEVLIKPEPSESRWPQPNRPRTDIDWYEAMAFCKWLSSKLHFDVRLPTDQQWERAARGVEGNEYPWGKDYVLGRANIDETTVPGDREKNYLGQTSAVGLYSPLGDTKDKYKDGKQVADLAGNVWEWCLNKYETGKESVIEPDASGDFRVLRGGSWLDLRDSARASLRHGNLPVNLYVNVGFRVCSPI
jgi:formylglycine-generating enzyme required for sulfatase activity